MGPTNCWPSCWASSLPNRIRVLRRHGFRAPMCRVDLGSRDLVDSQFRDQLGALPLRFSAILLGRQRQPKIGFEIVLRDALSLQVQKPEARLREAVSLLRGARVPAGCLFIIT